MGVLSHIRFRTGDESWMFLSSPLVGVSAPNPVQILSKIGARLTSVHSQAEEALCMKGHLDSAGENLHF
jgi:hypothetical protein